MGKINLGRVILGGIVAGLVGDILGYVVDNVMLSGKWMAANQHLGLGALTSGQILGYNLLGLIAGLVTIWFYAAAKPRLGSRYRTVLNVSLGVWLIGYVVPNAGFMYVSGMYPPDLMVYTTLGALVEVFVGTMVGAQLYRESVVAAETPKAAAV